MKTTKDNTTKDNMTKEKLKEINDLMAELYDVIDEIDDLFGEQAAKEKKKKKK
ncbi:hypothetical protein ACJA23_00920 [Mycoplasma corogypsi]|uniref:hypothetical protein n=1 Tax=Mycoplasma corogypsi TaxID=2106 RepID=UPI003872D2AF